MPECDRNLKDYNGVQAACIRRWMSATGLTPSEWCSMGYAKAFAEAWENKSLRKDSDAIYTVTLATARSVTNILNGR